MFRRLFFSLLALTAVQFAQAQLPAGNAAPAVNLPNSSAQAKSLSDLKGKVVLVDFWASWCGPCRRAMPEVKKLHHQYSSQNFEVYGISLDRSKADWIKALQQDGTPGVQVQNVDGDIANDYKVSYIPTTFLIDKKGVIRLVNGSPKALEKKIAELIAEKG